MEARSLDRVHAKVVDEAWTYRSQFSLAKIEALIEDPQRPTMGVFVDGELSSW